MKIVEEWGDLFEVSPDYMLVHCVSSDYAMGAGIAKEFQRRFNIRPMLMEMGHDWPTCKVVMSKGYTIGNLVTKEKYWHKPTLKTLYESLDHLRNYVRVNEIKQIAMPTIGAGLDKLDWYEVRRCMEFVFGNEQCGMDLDILVRKI